jgi:signal transduction histidine kinase/CheY-like chemotaxis protein
MAVTYLAAAWEPYSGPVQPDLGAAAVYLLISVLLLIGMAHIESVMTAHLQVEQQLNRVRQELELQVKKQTEDLANTHERLRQTSKMEAVGRLAGGVAHDFNNLLTIIQGYSQLLLAGKPANGDGSEPLEAIFAAAERAARLTRQLLAFSRRNVLQPEPADLNEVISDLNKMLRRVISEDIILQTIYAPNLPQIVADKGMMEQIIMNLVVNARDAMPKGGTLTITTEAVKVTDTHARFHNEAYRGDFVCVSVRDTGCGMSAEVKAHLFEPFFTTKEIGKGTGLGLATVYGIVKQHEGWVEVSSEPNKGTEFRVFLPRTAKSVSLPEPNPARPEPLAGKETILLVEDEEEVRRLTRLVLTQQGYQVLEADCGTRALEVWQRQGDGIDLLLTDLIMPGGITGRDLATRMKATRPQLPVMFVSGYSPSRSGQDLRLMEGMKFLPKPYDPTHLLRSVRECLDVPS